MAHTRDKICSPCVRNCCLDESQVCLGCFRYVDEICSWNNLSKMEQQQVLQRAQKRKARRKLNVSAV